MLTKPAVQAALIQVVALALLAALVKFSFLVSHPLYLTHFSAAIAQGLLAGLLSRWRGLAWWWIVIQLLFPLALLTTLALQLPPMLFLGGFLFLVLLYWSTFRTQVPFYPSGPAVWREVEALLLQDRPIRLVDIGSGMGGLVCNLSRRRPDSEFVGIELAPMPWLISRLRALLTARRARFTLGNYENLDFSQFDVVFAYLSPAAMENLWRKARTEMRVGTLLLSFEFPIPDHAAAHSVAIGSHGKNLYCWYF